LVKNSPEFITNKSNPFDENEVPIMCDFIHNSDYPTREAYESGNRSIILEREDGWFKAKGIGIPSGVSKPVYDEGRIFTYLLYDEPNMCHKTILWGFMQEQEYRSEFYGAMKAEQLGQRLKLLGSTQFDNTYFIKMRNRNELFEELHKTNRDTLLQRYKEKGELMKAYSVYTLVPSDIRVGELFYVLMFPRITELIDPQLIREYIEWIGSSCGHLLKTFHDSGSLHGTWVGNRATSLGLKDVHSNSYTGNYLIDDIGLTMCDFDLAKPIEDETLKQVEKWALVHVENPLYYAGSYMPQDPLVQGIAKKNPFREELVAIFEKAVDLGYEDKPGDLEKSLKRSMLELLVKAKLLMWKQYNLPEDLVGNIYYIDYQISNTKIDEKKFREATSTF
jgi:hypothetical protein